ncbi:CdiA C-terminal domain-containing protein [Mycolicibacterium stellerae]|uniref:CdiA C-terminal domain-containing protein n=1 Tax=Mycolicibacterium stellerae TaxID=2358193 RepID=UPI000F0B1D70|nr:hypothetical protein [Mycolicibacterium stellerae]
MTQDVDTDTYYAVGSRLFELAGEVYDAFSVNVRILGDTAPMAGTDDAGTVWATSYDGRAREVLDSVNDLTTALQNYGGVIIQAGYNHAVAEYNATAGDRGAPPQRPPEPASVAGVLTAPPSAGGPGQGLLDDALGLVEQVGVPVPDGDTIKVDTAAQVWDRLATVYQTKTVVEALEVNARAFSDTQSPEVEYLTRDLRELRDATAAILAGCSELVTSCRDYKAALEDLRQQLEDILTDLAVELAATAVISIFAACVSFGVGAAAGTAKAAHTITKFASTIRSAIGAWKISKRISQGVKKAHDIAGARKRLERIKSLARKGKREDPASPVLKNGNLTVSGQGFSASEREAAEELANRGHDVLLRQADPSAGRMSDLTLDGVPYDVYTPRSGNIDRLVGAIADKSSQVRGGGIVLDLRNSPLTPEQVGDLLPRVRGITDKISDIIVIG